MRVLSLFAGIGGMDLGLERAGMTVVGQVEIDPFCRRVLRKHWPDVWQWDDVKTLTGDLVREHCGSIDLICGGFPCQDISNAGKRAGIDGERSGLWSEFARLIREVRPRYVLVENVAALLVRGIGRVLGDLANLGLDAEWSLLSACSVGFTHTRSRLFIVAYSNSVRLQWERSVQASQSERRIELERLLESEAQVGIPAGSRGRMSDGVPDRVDRTRGLGNAVVPQVAELIGRAIMEAAA